MEAMDNANNCNNSESDQSDTHSPRSPKVCYGCKKPIEDEYRFRVSPDLEWHASCLVCSECQKNLDENCTCFLKEGRPYCKEDYVRLFGVKCAACLQPISGTDYVMRARDKVYHMQCFCCSSCEKHLVQGEWYGISNGKLFCTSDFELLQHETVDSPTDISDPSNIKNKNGSNGNNNSTNSARNNSTSIGGSGTSGGGTTKRSNSDKGPRVRTVLSEQQLQTLRTVYASNTRPDALMKEHLVEITGLSPRVIRVWFQNKRCKDKKKLIQNEAVRLQQQQHQALQGGPNSVLPPLTPQTPLTPDSIGGQISPHPGMPAFTYPPAPASYDTIQPIPSTPTHTAVSPIVTYQQNSAWSSPTSTIPHFDPAVDYSSSITTADQQSFVYSTAITSTQNSFFL